MKKPKIGIVFHREIRDNYGKTLYEHGGLPLYLSVWGDPKEYLREVDALVFSGGGDPLPALYQEPFTQGSNTPDVARDFFEFTAIREGVAMGMPILGICRGMQMINVALGGKLFQDIGEGHIQKENPMTTTDEITIHKNSKLYDILQKDILKVNSFHHQAVKTLGNGLSFSARSGDGICEAFEGDNILGFQWHIEWLNHRDEEKKIFQYFIGRAYDYSQKT